MKAEWRCAMATCGAVCVMTAGDTYNAQVVCRQLGLDTGHDKLLKLIVQLIT